MDFKGAKCFYKVEGKGKAIMLVHGFIEEGSMWDVAVEALKKNYKVIVPDLPGFGSSAMISKEVTLSMELYAEYLYEILKQEKTKQLILLGHSMGGYVALNFAEKYGEMLLGFGLLNSHCFEDSPEKKVNRKKGIEFIKKNGTTVFITELYNNIFHESFKKKNQKLINELIAKALKYTPESVIRANEAMMNRKGKQDVLKNAKVPVLLVNGKEDESAPFSLTLQQASLPNVADVHFFSPCKHMSIFEREKETIGFIEGFVKMV